MLPIKAESCPAPLYKILSAGIRKNSPLCRWCSANFPSPAGPAEKEQRLVGNSPQLVHPVSPFVHLSVTRASDSSVSFTVPGGEGSSSLSTGPGAAGGSDSNTKWRTRRLQALVSLPSVPTPHRQKWLWSTNHSRWVNRRMNSSNSCLLEISFCDSCSRAEKQNHIQKIPVGQWTSRGPTSNTSPQFQRNTARWDR